MSNKTHSFNVLLDDQTYTNLIRMANDQHLSAGQIVRDLISRAALMTLSKVPTCANGQNCYVPHMHIALMQPPPPTPPNKAA